MGYTIRTVCLCVCLCVMTSERRCSGWCSVEDVSTQTTLARDWSAGHGGWPIAAAGACCVQCQSSPLDGDTTQCSYKTTQLASCSLLSCSHSVAILCQSVSLLSSSQLPCPALHRAGLKLWGVLGTKYFVGPHERRQLPQLPSLVNTRGYIKQVTIQNIFFQFFSWDRL